MKSRYIIPIFVPHKGCPNQCIFCNQKKISGQIKEIDKEDVKKTISYFLKLYPKNKETEVAFYGGSFTAIDKEKQIELLETVQKYISDNLIQGIRISTRPDYISQDILDYLKEYNVQIIELGVQSMCNQILDRSSRGHTAEDVIKASKLIKENGFTLGLQMMVGLPQSTEDMEIYTAKEFIKLKTDIVRIYPVLVIKDTLLAEEFVNGKYVPYDVKRAVNICSVLVKMFEENNIKVIRVGLQNTDNIDIGKDVLAGPFHKNFGELVKENIMLEKIEKEIRKNSFKNEKIIIECKNSNLVIGYKKQNIKYIKEKYNIDIEINKNTELEKNEILLRKE